MNVRQEPIPMTNSSKTDRRRRPGRKIEILKAVMTLLERDDHKVTTAALAAEVGLSEAALYRHFSGKSAIFKALTDYIEEHLLNNNDELLNMDTSPLEQLKQLYIHHMHFFKDHPGLCRVYLVEGIFSREETIQMVALIIQFRQMVKQLLLKAQNDKELSNKLDLDAVVDLYVGMIQSAALRFVMSGFKATPDEDTNGSWHLFSRAISN